MNRTRPAPRLTPYLWVATTALIGLLLSGGAYYYTQKLEEARLRAHFAYLVHDRVLRSQNHLDQALQVLTSAQGLFDATEQVTRKEFELMVAPALARHPEIMAINWAPRVLGAEREQFEHDLRTQGKGGLGICDVTPDASQARKAGERPEYFPVLFSEPSARNHAAIGMDPYADPENRAAMNTAMRKGIQWSTPPFAIVQAPHGPLAVAIYQPVYRRNMPVSTPDARQAALRGFLILLLRPGPSLEAAVFRPTPIDLHARLLDPNHRQPLIHQFSSRLPDATIQPGETLHGDYSLALPGRNWILQVTATRGFRNRAGSNEPMTVLLAGLSLSGLICLLVWMRSRQTLQQKKIEFALFESESRFRQLADNLDTVFWINTPDWQHVLYISPAYERIWGRSAESLYQRGMDWFDAVLEEDRPAILERLPDTAGADWQTIEFPPYRIRRPDGGIRWISARAFPIRDEQGRVNRVAGIAEDISERQSHQQHLEEMAHYDPLTHLPNRLLLADRMHLALAHSRRTGQLLAVCMLDLDGFKPVNDKFGHEIGDQLLIEVARRLLGGVRGGDTVARLGGDEFVILLGALNNVKEMEEALTRLLQVVALPYALVDQPINISASVGVTIYPSDSSDADTLLRHADHAMYLAKQAGKNRYHQFNPVLEERARDNRAVLGLIGNAVENNQLRLFYQPIVDCRRGLVIGMEALLRWDHPILGLMEPAEFLPLVDGDDDLARSVGAWILRNAIQQADDWRQAGLDVPVSVNTFVQQLRDARFPELVRDLLAQHPDLPASRLSIEILENTALDDFTSVTRLIRICSSLGVRFALDDFGTGFSSLAYLRRLPVDTLKIDQSFVGDMLQNPDDLAIVESVIGLGAAFRRQVIAEGVESADHVLMLMEMGCYRVQGYGIAKPMPAEEVLAWTYNFQPDPRWHEHANLRLSRDDFQLVLAEVNHRHWLTSLQNWMRQPPDQRNPPPPLNEHECNFGHWYYGEGASRYGHMPEFRTAEALHEQVHRLEQKLVRQTEAGEVALSRETATELMTRSESFRDTLIKIRSAVKHIDAGQ
ncbi:MAG: hypothetical protein B7Y41_03940 [Hydrogenophilales bacterium 28-61-23]|nr:MAG: hypothetical protein B7Y41_03940 [Hydrogenophilales bacterium 28-61-23]